MKWITDHRTSPGGLMAILGYIVLAVAVSIALWLQYENSMDIQETNTKLTREICEEVNDVKEAMIRVQNARQPLPLPEGGSETVEHYNQIQEAYVERFEEEMQPSDCDDLR